MYYQDNYLKQLYNMQDQINAQIQQAQRQPTVTQNFQIAPQQSTFKIVKGEEDVSKELVIADTYFLASDNSMLWIKNARGDIRKFGLEEVIQKDEKDLLIEKLQKQIEEMKGSVKDVTTANDGENGNAVDAK